MRLLGKFTQLLATVSIQKLGPLICSHGLHARFFRRQLKELAKGGCLLIILDALWLHPMVTAKIKSLLALNVLTCCINYAISSEISKVYLFLGSMLWVCQKKSSFHNFQLFLFGWQVQLLSPQRQRIGPFTTSRGNLSQKIRGFLKNK